jgi:hypothetical protein
MSPSTSLTDATHPGERLETPVRTIMRPGVVGVTHLVVSRVAGEAPQGVVAPMDLVTLVMGERR